MAEVRRWTITPRRVLVAFVTLVVFGLIVSPAAVPGSGGLLTTYASDPGGARGFFEITRRLGWPTTRLLDRFEGPLDSAAIYAILRPAVPLTSREVSAVLDAVRRGAGLLLVPGSGSAFADSLGVVVAPTPPLGVDRVDSAAWDSLGGLTPTPRWPLLVLRTTKEAPESVVVMLAVKGRGIQTDSTYPAVLGIPLGRGRIVMMGHGSLFANVQIRERSNAVLLIRMLEWLAPGRRPPLIFAEYHQGHGQHPSVMKTIRRELAYTPGGRVVLQLLIAAGLLLLAVGIRPIAPRARIRSERRSPLEHVGALADAYAQVNAARTALHRLTRGLRRRHPIGTLRSASDDEYLSSLAARHPSLAADVDVLLKLINDRPTPERFEAGGAAIAHIERTLST
jgi:uncharacterized protein DUF4350